MTPEEKMEVEQQLSRLTLPIDKDVIYKAIEKAKEVLEKPFGGFYWQVEINLSSDPFVFLGELSRYTCAPCHTRLRLRRTIPMMKYYYGHHVKRHGCQGNLPKWEEVFVQL